jgi:tRNA A58 N-methylase Trm61
VRPGMHVLEPGPGMGFFTLALARMVGPTGKIVAVDSQQKMINGLKRRARNAGLADRIDARVAPTKSMALRDYDRQIDFEFAFAVVHEMPSADNFFAEAAQAMKSGAILLFAEPIGHVGEAEFLEQIAKAAEHGLRVIERPTLSRTIAVLLQKI